MGEFELRWSTDAALQNPPEPPLEARLPTVAVPPTSWRAWTRCGDLLHSLTSRAPAWEGPVYSVHPRPDGKGLRRVHPGHGASPSASLRERDELHDHGIHSYKRPLDLVRKLRLLRPPGPFWRIDVLGRIENYGHVVEHELGYRAQYVAIQALWLLITGSHRPPTEFVAPMEERFRCPVHLLDLRQVSHWAAFFTAASSHPQAGGFHG